MEDDQDISNMIATYLRNEQYQVIQIENGREALALLESHIVDHIDLFLLDIMSPDIDGIELCLMLPFVITLLEKVEGSILVIIYHEVIHINTLITILCYADILVCSYYLFYRSKGS